MAHLPHCLHKLFKSHHPRLEVNLSLTEKDAVFSISGEKEKVNQFVHHIFQTVSDIGYYQVDTLNQNKRLDQTRYSIGIPLSRLHPLANIFWFFNKNHIKTKQLLVPHTGQSSYPILEEAILLAELKSNVDLPAFKPSQHPQTRPRK